MERSEVLTIFEQTEAMRSGHFILTSGLHSPVYFQCARVLQHPNYAQLLCGEIARHYWNESIDVVISPAVGGIIAGHEVARSLGARFVFAERDELAAAQRELREETGYVFNDWKLIHVQQSGSGKIDHLVYTFLATDLKEIVPQQLDAGEKIEVKPTPFSDFKAMQSTEEMHFYPHYVMDTVTTLEALLALPSLHDYGN